MKTAKEWQDQLNGETSIQSIEAIQADAIAHAIQIIAVKASDFSPLGVVHFFASSVITDINAECPPK